MNNNILTHKEFVEKLLIKNEFYKNKDFTLLSNYLPNENFITVGNEFGICRIRAITLLKGNKISIQSAVDKHDYFLKELYKINKGYREGRFDILTKYVSEIGRILTKNKYGEFSVNTRSLKLGNTPSIESAINKTKCWLSCAKDKNVNFDKYTYDKVEYKTAVKKIIITCPIHGDFKIKPHNFTSKSQGCRKCSSIIKDYTNNSTWSNSNWQKASKNSKNFDSFKVYIIRCWNENEEFYKIGKTYKTLNNRFNTNSIMPYFWEKVEEYISNTAEEATKLESKLKKENKLVLYKPLIIFAGYTECFKSVMVDTIEFK